MHEAPIRVWGEIPAGVHAVLERLQKTEGVVRVAVMPDVHLAGEFCVGTVVASEGVIYPNAVGGDIGCGMLALQFAVEAQVLRDGERAARLLGALHEACPGRRHHRRTAHVMPADLRAMTMSNANLDAMKNGEDCRTQLGTLGAGNHFLELQEDEQGALWLMLHTGSRHLGQCVLAHYLPQARRLASGVMALEVDSGAGRAYLADVAVARQWARENRRLLARSAARVVEQVLGVGAYWETLYDCDHNHLVLEMNEGRELFVHRKGATAAALGEKGIVPGSMGTRSFHTVGLGNQGALCSSSHGAGRAWSRAEAREKVTVSALRQQMRGVWYDARIERQLREEAPRAYKGIEEVMRAQAELTKVARRLRPMLVYKQ